MPVGGQAVAPMVPKPPAAGATQVGLLEVSHGSGCGGFGSGGTYEGALHLLQEQAASMGATAISVTVIAPPHATESCYDRRFQLQGIAYENPSPAAPSAQEVAPARVDPSAEASTPAVASDATDTASQKTESYQ